MGEPTEIAECKDKLAKMIEDDEKKLSLVDLIRDTDERNARDRLQMLLYICG